MKSYYVMVRFGGPYVTGFVVPQADNEAHALKILKRTLWVRANLDKDKKISPGSDFSHSNVKAYIRSLKRPWRKSGEYRKDNFTLRATEISDSTVVRIIEMQLPVKTGYWLKDIIQNKELCNIHQ